MLALTALSALCVLFHSRTVTLSDQFFAVFRKCGLKAVSSFMPAVGPVNEDCVSAHSHLPHCTSSSTRSLLSYLHFHHIATAVTGASKRWNKDKTLELFYSWRSSSQMESQHLARYDAETQRSTGLTMLLWHCDKSTPVFEFKACCGRSRGCTRFTHGVYEEILDPCQWMLFLFLLLPLNNNGDVVRI